MSITSPKGYEVRRLEGRPGDIRTRGEYLVGVGDSMETTAAMLTKIADGDAQIADSVDKIRKIAGEIDGDLRKAGIRYSGTGEALKTYAAGLTTAQNAIHPIIDDIESAHAAVQTAQGNLADAKSDLKGLENPGLFDEEPTDQQLASAGADVGNANSALTTAKNHLDDLWTTFETAFEAWEKDYDEAVEGVQQAMDSADNNDGGWEILDNVLDIAGWVVIGLGVLALIITGPLGILITVLAIALSAAILVGQIVKVANGRGSWTDVAVAAIGLLSFGAGGLITKLAGKGGPAVATLMRSGRGAVYQSVRATLPRFSMLHPFRSLGAWWTARGITRAGTRIPLFQNPLNAIRFGDEYGQYATFLNRVQQNFGHHPGVASWLTNPGRVNLPGRGYQAAFAGAWGGGLSIDLGNNFGAFDGLKDREAGH